MSLDTATVANITDRVVSHAMQTGLFEQVNQAEPKNAPGHGLSAAVWPDKITPVRTSGLDSVSGRLVYTVRIYSPLLSRPEDEIDPAMINAVDALFTAYCGDFTLDGLVRNVDIFGSDGIGLDAQAGYLIVEGGEYRVITITLPLIVNDLWTEGT
ncbi:hypothetical protein [Streptomyces sp. NBC_01508]|uniref:hypothetical protein n=1 Tax=Streptomyces sp. NBC_01508 TaxID=2903888 RepID=UPI003863BBE2